MTFYQTEHLDAARKKLQMGVHLGAAFAELAQPVQQAQSCLQRLRAPKMAPGTTATPALQPGQYPLLMQAQDWAQALTLCVSRPLACRPPRTGICPIWRSTICMRWR
ncbi:hypothetical protein [Comamonas sp. JC664]|uniref:hypothetical protein n=1 Tax=Comamonas sp. JC664 TaxID=2801917 RepID=UPI00360FCE5B